MGDKWNMFEEGERYVCFCAIDKHIIMDYDGEVYELYECEDVNKLTDLLNNQYKIMMKQESLADMQESLINGMENKSMTVYTVREGDRIVALFPNEHRARFYCMEHDANLHYQKERWGRL